LFVLNGVFVVLKMKVVFLASAVAVLSVSGAQAQGPKEQQGELVGGFFGSLLSNIPGGGSTGGQILRSLAPTIGSLIGGSIGAQLDADDRAALQRASSRALNSGATQSFKTKSGVKGKVSVVKRTKNASGEPCVTLKQDVVLKSGQAVSDNVSACKGAKGWSV
jgi:surface antigen